MNKKTKAIYVLGSVLIGALAVLCVYFILMATGVITVQKPKVVVSSSGASKEYDGTELTNDSWSLVTGELKKGHTIEVTTTGVQTDIGSSSNLFSVKIKNAKGKDVTDDYVVESKPGDLVVTKRKIEVTIEDESKIYDGEVLLPQSYNLTKGTLLKGHTLDVTLNGERVEVGLGYANAVCVVTDALGEEHTDNYEIIVVKGELLVNPIPITIKTGSAVKYYDGEPLTCDTYEVVSIYQLLDGHQIQISI